MLNRNFVSGALFGAVIAVASVTTTAAVAGTGPGGIFNLGRTNTVNGTTALKGSSSAAQLHVTNSSSASTAFGLRVTTAPGRPPFAVNSSAVVKNLNASLLGGRPASSFLPVSGTAADSRRLGGRSVSDFLGATATAANSAKLGGRPASDFLGATDTAADANKLGGYAASQYARTCDAQGAVPPPGALAGMAEFLGAAAGESWSEVPLLRAWVCTGDKVLVKRVSTGVYRIQFGDTVRVIDGDPVVGYPWFGQGGIAIGSALDPGYHVAVYGPQAASCSDSGDAVYRTCVQVQVTSTSTGAPMDGNVGIVVF